MPYYIIIVGTAGSGKTTLAGNLKDYLEDHQLDAAVINLDPAVEKLPYEPDVDVRDYVDARRLMEELGLGPNGALIASMDLLALKISEIKEEIDALRSNYFIIDTPGQMEIFAFRRIGPLVLNNIVGDSRRVSLFLIDGPSSTDALSLLSSLLLSASVHARLAYPQVNVVTKIDLVPEEELERIEKALEEPDFVADALPQSGYLIWTGDEVSELLEKLSLFDTVFLSNVDGRGFDNLYAALQRVLAGGEDFYTEEPSAAL